MTKNSSLDKNPSEKVVWTCRVTRLVPPVVPPETNQKNGDFGFSGQLTKILLLFFSAYILWINIYRSFCIQIIWPYHIIHDKGRYHDR